MARSDRYLVILYANGARVPSWLASDGTSRLLALTIPAYLRNLEGVFLVEEPENGIHPRAIETVIQSLSSIYAYPVAEHNGDPRRIDFPLQPPVLAEGRLSGRVGHRRAGEGTDLRGALGRNVGAPRRAAATGQCSVTG